MSWKRFLSQLYLLCKHWRGPDRLFVESFNIDSQCSLTAVSLDQYEISIQCLERRYNVVSAHTPHREPIVVYELSAWASQNAPELLKDACRLKITLPRPYPTWVLKEYHVDRVLQQYLDLLLRHVELHQYTTPQHA